jgi:hypothetical protein
MGGRHQLLDAVATADFQRHDSVELGSEESLLDLDGPGDVAAVGEPLLSARSNGDNSDTRCPSA